MGLFVDVKDKILCIEIFELLSPSVYNPTPERLLNRAEKYQANAEIKVFVYKESKEYNGIIAFEINQQSAEIFDIAVKPEHQGKGIGRKLIDFIYDMFGVNRIIAETDIEAIGFYKKCGFTVEDTKIHLDTKRYICIKRCFSNNEFTI